MIFSRLILSYMSTHYWIRMKRMLKYVLLGLICLPIFALAQPKKGDWDRKSNLERALFSIKSVQRLSDNPDSVRVDLFVEIMYDLLQFVREDSSYKASLELGLSILQDEGQILRLTKYLSAETGFYEITNSRKESVNALFPIELTPGSYTVHVNFRDRESKRSEKITEKLKLVKPKQRIINLSDIMLTRSTELNSGTDVPLYPIIRKEIFEKMDMMYCHFDLFRVQPAEVTAIYLTLSDKGGSQLFADTLSLVGGESLSSYFMNVDTKGVKSGIYTVLLRAESGGSVAEKILQFKTNLHGLPSSIRDVDMAIKQLKYIAKASEIKKLEEMFPSDKEKQFIKFWNDNFEVPGQLVNGKMTEYYRRVEYANEHFSDSRSGWETDRGQIFIIYGHPSEIERSDIGDQNRPYEIWRYHHLNKSFLFRDDFGFGDYKLESPVW